MRVAQLASVSLTNSKSACSAELYDVLSVSPILCAGTWNMAAICCRQYLRISMTSLSLTVFAIGLYSRPSSSTATRPARLAPP